MQFIQSCSATCIGSRPPVNLEKLMAVYLTSREEDYRGNEYSKIRFWYCGEERAVSWEYKGPGREAQAKKDYEKITALLKPSSI